MPGKFDSPRDEALYIMSVGGWANQSDGDVEAPTGYFCRISNTEREIPEIVEAFEEELATIDVAAGDLIGHYLCVENSQGFWDVTSFDTEAEVEAAYAQREAEFAAWATDEEGAFAARTFADELHLTGDER